MCLSDTWRLNATLMVGHSKTAWDAPQLSKTLIRMCMAVAVMQGGAFLNGMKTFLKGFDQSPFQEKSVHFMSTFATPLGSYFGHPRPSQIYHCLPNWQLNNTFQISNKVWHKVLHKCYFFCSSSDKKCLFSDQTSASAVL